MVNWTQLLHSEMERNYAAANRLLNLVDADNLGWKPENGGNWMTIGQLLRHLTGSCGSGCKGFLTGNWGMPEGMKMEEMALEDILPPAEKMPAVESVAEARKLLAEDKALALRMIEQAGEEQLSIREIAPPWAPNAPEVLGRQMLFMVEHLNQHKGQLFYYLKLQGKPVKTPDLWG
jgi:uncharacterized damage-inducible protein DinB